MGDVTVVYYTANVELPRIEEEARRIILEAKNGAPLVSVSQVPMDFGENVCVGRVGISAHNAWRQLRFGLERVKTPWVCTAEADFFYNEEYFKVRPPSGYQWCSVGPVYLAWVQAKNVKCYARKPKGSEGALVAATDALKKRLDEMLAGRPLWGKADGLPLLLEGQDVGVREIGTPLLTFKTDFNMHRKSHFSRDSVTRTLEPWGPIDELCRRFL